MTKKKSPKNKPQEKERDLEFFKPLEKAAESAKTAMFYGFSPAASPAVLKNYIDIAEKEKFDPVWEGSGKIAMLREYEQARNSPNAQSSMFWFKKPFKGTGEKSRHDRLDCEIVILNSNKSVAESLLIQTTKSILEDAGYKNLGIRINSMGNKDSAAEYERKTAAYIKKKISIFPQELRQLLKKDIFFLAKTKQEKWAKFAAEAPQSMDYLNEQSRNYFKEILEFLETIGLFYSIDPSLIGDPKYCTEAVYEITDGLEPDAEVLARGSRWNKLSRILQHKKEVPAASIHIKASLTKPEKETVLKRNSPKFYLVQFGPEAKLKSFLALEELRKAGTSVAHALTKDKLVSQMAAAEQMDTPYLVIIGQKEALEKSVIIRSTSTRAQCILPIGDISSHVKNIK